MRIVVFTGARSEWGLLKRLVHELDRYFEVYLLVSGQHLSPTYGYTCTEIDFDLLRMRKIEMLLDGDSPAGMCKSIALGVIGYVQVLESLSPDMVVLLGDRFETFAMAQTAFTMGISISHIHGGEITQGSLDNGYRNAITQLSRYHFTSTRYHKSRVMNMIGDSKNVWNVGALGLEDLPEPIKQKSDRLFLIYHPVNLPDGGLGHLENIFECLPEHTVYIVGSNSDAWGRKINNRLKKYAYEHPKRHFFQNFKRDIFLGMLNACRGIIGNSSCGIIEAPSLRVGTIDVGPRQKGRERGNTVIECPNGTKEEIQQALKKLYSEEFDYKMGLWMGEAHTPYGGKGAAEKIRKKIQEMETSRN